MNDRFLLILVAKIEVWISISLNGDRIYRPNWKSATTKSCASPQSSTLDSSHTLVWWHYMRTMSGACDGEGCWSRLPCTCSDAIYADADYVNSLTPAICGAGNLHQTMPLPVPARHSNARQQSTDVCQHELSVYGILVNCRPPIVHMRWSVTASGGRGFNN